MLADGTKSQKQSRCMETVVQTSNGKKTKLQFFVMAGPNNLLGRLALKDIWPEQFKALKDVAEVPIKKVAVPVGKPAKVKSQSGSVYKPAAARASLDLGQQRTVCPTPAVAVTVDPVTTANTALPER